MLESHRSIIDHVVAMADLEAEEEKWERNEGKESGRIGGNLCLSVNGVPGRYFSVDIQ